MTEKSDLKDVAPTTIGGIKRLAKALKKAEGIPHHAALDRAAQAAAFRDYRHARSVLQPTD